MLSPGQSLTLTIEKPAAGGRMIARHDGQVILVGGAIPGERVRARVERSTHKVAYAETISVDEPSTDRRAWDGDIQCGGCVYGHIAYPRQLEIKAAVIADAFARIGRIVLPASPQVAASPESGYRMRARLHVRGSQLGFFREATHDLCDVRQTRQLLPATCDVVDRLDPIIRSLGLGAIREIELAENGDASARVLAIDSASPIDRPVLERISAVEGVTGVVSAGKTIGDAHVTDTVEIENAPKLQLRRHVLAFFQGNRFLLSPLAAHVASEIAMGGNVIDLYAGGGLFSVAAAEGRRARVVAVEGDRVAAADLVANSAARSGIMPVHQSVEQYLSDPNSKSRGADLRDPIVIVDPPRTGISKEALGGIIRVRAPRIVYVSCDVATLARDARAFVDAGYGIGAVRGFDLFPNTPHVETVVTFSRA
jgi:23S rRNA (uracil1939-C5)-methyltransferase